MNHVTDMSEQALAGLLSQFAESTNLRKLLQLFADEVQTLEDTVYACVAQRMLDSAAGAQLDQYGVVVGQHRLGMTDERYRRLLRVRIVANRSFGAAAAVVYCASVMVDAPVRYRQHGVANYRIDWETAPAEVTFASEQDISLNLTNHAVVPPGSYTLAGLLEAMNEAFAAAGADKLTAELVGNLVGLRWTGSPEMTVGWDPGSEALRDAIGFEGPEVADLGGLVVATLEHAFVPVETSTEWLAVVAATVTSMTPAGVGWTAVEGSDRSFRFDTAGRGFDAGLMGRRVV